MDAVAEPIATEIAGEDSPRRRRFGVTPAIEFGVLAAAIAIATVSYFVIVGERASERLEPSLVALLLVANLVPGVALMVLFGRRVAHARAARSPAGGEGRLHVRLVAIFSVLASVPTLFVAVMASLLFQYGVEFWFSDRARGMIENAQALAQESYKQLLSYVDSQTVAMAVDVSNELKQSPPESLEFQRVFAAQIYVRSLSEAIIFTISPGGQIQTIALVNPYERDLEKEIDRAALAKLNQGQPSVVEAEGDRTRSLTRIPDSSNLYLYAGRASDLGQMSAQTDRAAQVLSDYRSLVSRSRSLQLQFNAALLVLSLVIVGIAVWVALQVADRLVRPVNELVGAAHRVAAGDLTARVPETKSQDEVGVLAGAFNQMTGRLQAQTNALVTANRQLESRRALIEAVMSGVTAGVISIGGDRTVRLINASALALLRRGDQDPVGKPLREIAPDLDELLDQEGREAIVQINTGGDARTLAVKITSDEGGQVLTFDDITQQLNDQRRAAWADVARRIAHEIKNPLTPIQLAAERLQRRYGKQIDASDGVFARLTDTIVRQVGDLRRMVDEFSSFARMPKPMFRRESLLDISRQAMFLHEVAHPAIQFTLNAPEDAVQLVCDRRQIGQALTNVVKNAVEAIEAREGDDLPHGQITLDIDPDQAGRVLLRVSDNGIGLPMERDRIVEPYMTTRSRGTGLGLAIVKKIVEEHSGTIAFADKDGGGTVVTVCFDTEALDTLAIEDKNPGDGDQRPPALTRNGKTV